MYMMNDSENGKERPLSQLEESAIIEGLCLVLEKKREAFATIRDESKTNPAFLSFTEKDFGIPGIVALLDYLAEE